MRGQDSNLQSRAHEARGMPFPHRASMRSSLSVFCASLPPFGPGSRPAWRGAGARCRALRPSSAGPFSLGRGLGQSVVFFKLGITFGLCRLGLFKTVLERKKAATWGRPRSCGSNAHGPLAHRPPDEGRAGVVAAPLRARFEQRRVDDISHSASERRSRFRPRQAEIRGLARARKLYRSKYFRRPA